MKNLEQHLSPDNNEDTYLQDLVIETPPQTEPRDFNLERDITKEDWEGALETLDQLRESKQWSDFIELAAQIHVLDPTRNAITEEDWEEVQWSMDSTPEGEGYSVFVAQAAAKSMINPEKTPLSEIDLDYIQDEQEALHDPDEADWGEFIPISAHMFILDPDRVKFTHADWQAMEDELGQARQGDRWMSDSVSSISGYLAILGRNKSEITEEDWEYMRQELKDAHNKKDYGEVIKLSFFLHILSADEIKVSKEKGLELIFNPPEEDFFTDMPLPPEKRI